MCPAETLGVSYHQKHRTEKGRDCLCCGKSGTQPTSTAWMSYVASRYGYDVLKRMVSQLEMRILLAFTPEFCTLLYIRAFYICGVLSHGGRRRDILR